MIRVVKNGWTTLYKKKSTQKLPKKKLWIIMQATIICFFVRGGGAHINVHFTIFLQCRQWHL